MYLHPPPANFNNEIQDAGTSADLPSNFDPNQYPILGKHWFGWKPVGEVTARLIQRKQPDALIEACHG